MKLLIDECLHTSLVELAHAAGHVADHDFLTLHGQEPLHAGVIIIVPNVTPIRQRELFTAALRHIGVRDLTNSVVEVDYDGKRIECREYALPQSSE